VAKQFEAKIEDIGASDYRAFFDSNVLRVWHLDGKERTFKIIRCQRIDSEYMGKRSKQPLLTLEDSKGRELPLPLALNKTNAKTIAQLYGTKVAGWHGKLITLYPTTTDVGNETRDCIRIRPEDPSKRARKGKAGPAQEQVNGADHDEPPMGALETDHAPESEHVQ